ncbi:MAG: low molecular weight protein-tyrosine-phosphatase [Inquilinaceae bacterium]
MKILFVCTGNICRSPTAEGVFRHRLAATDLAGRIEADSAGTHGYHVGDPADGRARRVAASRGYDLSSIRARKVTADDFQRFDTILAMDRGHLETLRRRAPDAERHRVRLFLEDAPGPAPAEVPDPYYGDIADFERVLTLIETGVDGLIDRLRREAVAQT